MTSNNISNLNNLVPSHIFGLRGDVKDNIWYVDENVVVYLRLVVGAD